MSEQDRQSELRCLPPGRGGEGGWHWEGGQGRRTHSRRDIHGTNIAYVLDAALAASGGSFLPDDSHGWPPAIEAAISGTVGASSGCGDVSENGGGLRCASDWLQNPKKMRATGLMRARIDDATRKVDAWECALITDERGRWC